MRGSEIHTEFPQTVTLIEGDGIGPEISGAVIRIFEAAQVREDLVWLWWGSFCCYSLYYVRFH